jgi:hypothetical protein
MGMCCFSQPVDQISNTNIFARRANGRQYLVYSMTYTAAQDLAMVLPLPVPPHPPEDAVRFINLERYPSFFDDMRLGFGGGRSLSLPESVPAAAGTLQVHEVGSFEASFVPTLDDFDRLDERFRIPRDVWDRLPDYHNYGFAVFKLKGEEPVDLMEPDETPRQARIKYLREKFHREPQERPPAPVPRLAHPMAFEFPRRNPELLYFPTVHVHDRSVHPSAQFDHMLYCQPDSGMLEYLEGWEEAVAVPAEVMKVHLTEGIVLPDVRIWCRPLVGVLENRDTLVGRAGAVPGALSI